MGWEAAAPCSALGWSWCLHMCQEGPRVLGEVGHSWVEDTLHCTQPWLSLDWGLVPSSNMAWWRPCLSSLAFVYSGLCSGWARDTSPPPGAQQDRPCLPWPSPSEDPELSLWPRWGTSLRPPHPAQVLDLSSSLPDVRRAACLTLTPGGMRPRHAARGPGQGQTLLSFPPVGQVLLFW